MLLTQRQARCLFTYDAPANITNAGWGGGGARSLPRGWTRVYRQRLRWKCAGSKYHREWQLPRWRGMCVITLLAMPSSLSALPEATMTTSEINRGTPVPRGGGARRQHTLQC